MAPAEESVSLTCHTFWIIRTGEGREEVVDATYVRRTESERHENHPEDGAILCLWHWVPETATRTLAALQRAWGIEHGMPEQGPSGTSETRRAFVESQFRSADFKASGPVRSRRFVEQNASTNRTTV